MAQANIVKRSIDDAVPGDVFMITPSVMVPRDVPWNFIVIIRVESDDAIVQRIDPVTDKTIKGFSTKAQLGLNQSNTTFIKTARTFEQRNRDFQEKYPFQPNSIASVEDLFQVPFNKAQMKDYPNIDSYCVGQTRLDCLFHALAALRLRSIEQCTTDARLCNANARLGVKYSDASNYLSKITGQRIKMTNMTIKSTMDILNTLLYDGYGTIVAIESKTANGEIFGHYIIAFKNGTTVDYYDPQHGYQIPYNNVVSMRLFVREVDDNYENDNQIVIPPISAAEADSHVIPHIGGFAKRRKTTRKLFKNALKIRRRHFKTARKHKISRRK
jgi:hypothetical protein